MLCATELLFLDSSDNDSDSDDDRDCCMFGVGKSQQMIVLKIREVCNFNIVHFITVL